MVTGAWVLLALPIPRFCLTSSSNSLYNMEWSVPGNGNGQGGMEYHSRKLLCKDILQPFKNNGPNLCSPQDWHSLGERGHLPREYIVSSWWVLKQFAPTLPSESTVGTFKKYPPIHPQRTHQIKCEFFVKEPSDLLRTDLAGTFWVLFKSTHQFAPVVPSG